MPRIMSASTLTITSGDCNTRDNGSAFLVRRLTARLLPTLGSNIVAVLGFHPVAAVRCLFQFPEWRAGLQPVDQEMAALEGRLPVGAGGCDQDDPVAGFQPAKAMHDQRGLKRPAPVRLCF